MQNVMNSFLLYHLFKTVFVRNVTDFDMKYDILSFSFVTEKAGAQLQITPN